MSDDWFTDAADKVVGSKAGKSARDAAEKSSLDALALERSVTAIASAVAASARLADDAAKSFAAVAAGMAPIMSPTTYTYTHVPTKRSVSYDSGRTGRPSNANSVTPDEAMKVILEAVSKAGDTDEVFRVGGEWITKLTNNISQIIRDADSGNDE